MHLSPPDCTSGRAEHTDCRAPLASGIAGLALEQAAYADAAEAALGQVEDHLPLSLVADHLQPSRQTPGVSSW